MYDWYHVHKQSLVELIYNDFEEFESEDDCSCFEETIYEGLVASPEAGAFLCLIHHKHFHYLILIINSQSLMNQSTQDLNLLELEIEQLQCKVRQLLDEELKQKNQNTQLERQIRELENDLDEQPKLAERIRLHHRTNLDYIDQKIQNHHRTLLKFKNFYESLQTSQLSQSIHHLNQDSMNTSYAKPSKFIKSQEMKQSIGSFSSSVSHKDTEGKKAINVVCEMECQNCGGVFKPYRYYSHINHCHKRAIVDAQMATSMLLD